MDIINREKQIGDHEMAIMGREGDTKVVWSKNNPNEVENARRTFADLRAKGFLAFKMDLSGNKGEQIKDFDPSYERIIFVPQMQGG